MPVFDRLIEMPLLRSIYLVFAACLVLLFAVACAIAVLNFDWSSAAESPAEYANGVALGIGAVITLVIASQHASETAARMFWWATTVGLLVLAANEAFDIFARMNRAWADDDYIDLIVLVLTPFGLYLACIIESVPPISLKAMKCGFAFQCISDLLDLGDGSLYFVALFNHNLVETVAELTELIFIETYLFGLACLLLSTVVRRLEFPPVSGQA
jgi:hypothetical protein